MTYSLVPPNPDDWKEMLIRDDYWKPGSPVWAVAHSWSAAKGLPGEILNMLGDNSKLIDMVVDYEIDMPGHGRGSICDVVALVQVGQRTCSLVVEAVVREPFVMTIRDWRKRGSSLTSNREFRIKRICEELGIKYPPDDKLKYKLFHRSLAALRIAKRSNVDTAVMIIQSFSKATDGFEDFENFCDLFYIKPIVGELVQASVPGKIQLYLGWAKGSERYLK